MTNQRGFSAIGGIIIGLVILAAAIGIAILILPKTTVGWERYRNEEFGYEIKYPDKYKLDDTRNPVIESATRRIVTLNLREKYYPADSGTIFSGVSIGVIFNKDYNSIDSECAQGGALS